MKNKGSKKLSGSWFSQAKAEAEKPLAPNERVFGIFIVVFCVLMIIFFVNHQTQSTGFFTLKFDLLEMLFFYGFWIFWITTAGLESIINQRLLSRIVDSFGGIIFAVISISFLLVIFPFDFSQIDAVLPKSIRFIVGWISNDIARIIMVLLAILHFAAAIYSPFAYKFIDRKYFKRDKKK